MPDTADFGKFLSPTKLGRFRKIFGEMCAPPKLHHLVRKTSDTNSVLVFTEKTHYDKRTRKQTTTGRWDFTGRCFSSPRAFQRYVDHPLAPTDGPSVYSLRAGSAAPPPDETLSLTSATGAGVCAVWGGAGGRPGRLGLWLQIAIVLFAVLGGP